MVKENQSFLCNRNSYVACICYRFYRKYGWRKVYCKILKKSNQFTYVTSITGNDGEKADVYESSLSKEDTVMTIIESVDGNVLDVEEDKTPGSESIAILTEDEYCMVYISVSNEVLVQISNRKYAILQIKSLITHLHIPIVITEDITTLLHI